MGEWALFLCLFAHVQFPMEKQQQLPGPLPNLHHADTSAGILPSAFSLDPFKQPPLLASATSAPNLAFAVDFCSHANSGNLQNSAVPAVSFSVGEESRQWMEPFVDDFFAV